MKKIVNKETIISTSGNIYCAFTGGQSGEYNSWSMILILYLTLNLQFSIR